MIHLILLLHLILQVPITKAVPNHLMHLIPKNQKVLLVTHLLKHQISSASKAALDRTDQLNACTTLLENQLMMNYIQNESYYDFIFLMYKS